MKDDVFSRETHFSSLTLTLHRYRHQRSLLPLCLTLAGEEELLHGAGAHTAPSGQALGQGGHQAGQAVSNCIRIVFKASFFSKYMF